MSAPTLDDVDTRDCEVCGEEFHRDRKRENRARFTTRRYCSRTCMGVARRASDYKPPKPRTPPVASTPPRIVDGTWRPAAPGWPDRPAIPTRYTR